MHKSNSLAFSAVPTFVRLTPWVLCGAITSVLFLFLLSLSFKLAQWTSLERKGTTNSLSTFLVKTIAVIFDFYGSRGLRRERNLYVGGEGRLQGKRG